MMAVHKMFPLTLLSLLVVVPACFDEEDDKVDSEGSEETGESGGESGDDSSGGGDDSSEPEPVEGTISGRVEVVLYTEGADGEREYISYADADALTEYDLSVFPFGKVFVAAYNTDAAGVKQFHGDATIDAPSIGGDDYSIDVRKKDGPGDVLVYAHVDWYQDRILGSWEPQEHYGDVVPITEGAEITSVDITILAPIPYSGGGTCDTVNVTGDVIITVSYAGGDVATFFQTTDGEGPYYASWTTVSADGGGASGEFTNTACVGLGEVKLRGAWDTNGNNIIDATDRWGGYITAPDTDGGAITVGSSSLSGYDVQIPLGGSDGFSLVPFTRISGEVSLASGTTFGDTAAGLPAGTKVYTVALKYRPSSEIYVSNFKTYAYDYETWDVADIATDTSKAYTLNVPAETIVYLWSFADTDGDGVLNEPGEPVAAGGGESSGRLPTGGSGASGISLSLNAPPSPSDTGAE